MMLTSSNITFVILEKGIDDKRLYEEINNILNIAARETKSMRDIYVSHPRLVQLMQDLRNEIDTN